MNFDIQKWETERFTISTDKALLQIDQIHKFLSEGAYWCLYIPRDVVARAIENSLCFGVYENASSGTKQVGYTRVVTDYASFAYICDVYIEPEYRGDGLSKWLMECVLSHAALQNLRRICLVTKDAHKLYEKFGFQVTQIPEGWMEIVDLDIYKKAQK